MRTHYSWKNPPGTMMVRRLKSNWPKNCFFEEFGQAPAANLVKMAAMGLRG
jgi:hypothetical protein